jgi:NDP-sugar pyrophosphorylase family protein
VLQAALFLWEEPGRARELGLRTDTLDVLRGRGDVILGRDVRIEGPVRLGANVLIENGVRLSGPIAIGSGARVAEGATIERSILFDDVVVGARARVLDSVLGEGVSVGAAARIESRPGAELTIDIKGKKVVPEIARLGVVAGDGVSIEASAVVPAGTLI